MSDDKVAGESEGKKKAGGMVKIILLILFALILAGGSAGGALYFSGMLNKKEKVVKQSSGMEEATETRDRALYIPLDPPFVVNLDDNGTLRFMQINVSLMSRDKAVIEEMGANTPRLKNDLLMLFVGQKYSELQLVEGRERLRQEALKLVQDIMLEISNVRGVEELYFTSFVAQ